ncbi:MULTISPECIES: AnBLUF65 family BLUF photoreceptors [Acinetobacter]|uniref:AnBLUF65 family BLUF photoreceptors n=1 Tax=Acinetobacter TaxID=469 RepID=UPI001250CF73|nr:MULTISPECIES: AnBLUF65 family BLUF photoreceptors [Acinetobacter]MCH2001543.1 BLUF domain-containing protein [Acinetobacter seifertii]MDK4791405.1 BLUF domain-containing protein [Acinetobacter sp.]
MNVRLCYASQRNEKNEDLLQDLRDILTEARDFNDLNEICGVLYYADNAFFQCLEGEQEVVEQLFEKIQKDERHYNVKWLCTYSIDQNAFQRWSMKYVQRNTNIEAFFLKMGENTFNPILLDQQNLKNFLNELLVAEQTKVNTDKKVGMVNRGVNPF